jgi:hypothetical protein
VVTLLVYTILTDPFIHILLSNSHHQSAHPLPTYHAMLTLEARRMVQNQIASPNIAIRLNPETFTANRIFNRNIILNLFSRLKTGLV